MKDRQTKNELIVETENKNDFQDESIVETQNVGIEAKNNIEQSETENIKLQSKNIVRAIILFLKIFISFICAIVVILFSIYFISPETDAKIFNFLGMNRLEELSYIRVYTKSDKATDLYNLVILEKQLGNYDKELEYINELKSRDDYLEFCEKINLTGIEYSNGQKDLYIYYADIEAYLTERQVVCMFNLNLLGENYDLAEFILESIESENLTETAFSDYLSLIIQSEELEKQEKVDLVTNLVEYDSEVTIISLILQRISEIDIQIESETDEVTLILLQNALVNHLKGVYYYEVILNGYETNTALTYKEVYNNALKTYLTMVS